MRFNVKQVFLGLVILTLTAAVALAKDHGKTKTESITFGSDISVNGTTVKAGTYDLKLNEQTGDLEILKGSKVIATASTHAEKRSDKARATEIHTANNGGVDQLISIAFRGKDENVVVGQAAQPTTGQD